MAIISISCLGRCGRFGNQLFQYAFARAYAEKYNATLQTPPWLGQQLFKLSDPPISQKLPGNGMDVVKWGQVNIDLAGYFLGEDFLKLTTRKQLRSWFTFQDWVSGFRKPPKAITAHLRRGDFINIDSFCVVSKQSYINACLKFGYNSDLITWVSEETQQRNVELERRRLPFLDDFLTLVDASVIFRSNSTFSWWAGVLSNAKVFSPLINNATGVTDVDFVEGNWPSIHRAYPNLHLEE